MKSTPTRGVKQFLKPDAYNQLEGPCGLTAYLLYNGWPLPLALALALPLPLTQASTRPLPLALALALPLPLTQASTRAPYATRRRRPRR